MMITQESVKHISLKSTLLNTNLRQMFRLSVREIMTMMMNNVIIMMNDCKYKCKYQWMFRIWTTQLSMHCSHLTMTLQKHHLTVNYLLSLIILLLLSAVLTLLSHCHICAVLNAARILKSISIIFAMLDIIICVITVHI